MALRLKIRRQLVPVKELKVEGDITGYLDLPDDIKPVFAVLVVLDDNNEPHLVRCTPDGHVLTKVIP